MRYDFRQWSLAERLDVALPLCICLFFLATVLPGVFLAYRSFAELWTYGVDDSVAVLDLYNLVVERIVPPLSYPGTLTYGLFPQLVAACLLLPFVVVSHIFDLPITTAHLVIAMRMTNVAFTLISLVYCYRITRLMSGPSWAALATLTVAIMFPVAWASITTKPDICQMSMGLVAAYYILRFQQTGMSRSLFIAAVFGGLSAGAKYYNIIFVGAGIIFVVLIAPAYRPLSVRNVLAMSRLLVACGLISISMFLISNFRWIVRYDEMPQFLGVVGSTLQSGQFSLAFWDTPWAMKLRLLQVEGFIGYPLAISSVVAMLWLGISDIVQRRVSLASTISIIICSFVFSFFIFWNFKPLILIGWRFLLQTACFLPIVVAAFGYRLTRKLDWRGRSAALVLLAIIFGFASVRITPTFALTSPRVAGYFGYMNKQIYPRETHGRFLVRDWIRKNVPKGSVVLGQWTTNVAAPAAAGIDEDDIDGVTLKSGFGFPDADEVKAIRPDYIVFSSLLDVDGPDPTNPFRHLPAIEAQCPSPGELTPIGPDRQTFVMRCSLGRPLLDVALGSYTVPANDVKGKTVGGWQSTAPATVRPDGTAHVGFGGTALHELTVPANASVFAGDIDIVGDTWHGMIIADVVWFKDDKQLLWKTEFFKANKNRLLRAKLLQQVPAFANKVIVSLRTWQPKDGALDIRKGVFSFYHPAAPAKGQWPLFDPGAK
jgi:hypothetical protein